MPTYSRDHRTGVIIRTSPRTFRRGRIRWVDGVMIDPKRVKVHSRTKLVRSR